MSLLPSLRSMVSDPTVKRNVSSHRSCLWAFSASLLLGVAAESCVLAAGCYSAPSGLAGWWPGDGNANDIASTNNGTLQGGATANAVGVVGSAFTFDGTNGYVQIPDSPALKPTNLTVEAWVQFTWPRLRSGTGAPAGEQFIVFKQNSRTGNFEGYYLGKTRISGQDHFTFQVSSASGATVELDSVTLVSDRSLVSRGGVRGSNYVQLYVNGQLESQTNVSFAQDYGTLPLYFGTSGQTLLGRQIERHAGRGVASTTAPCPPTKSPRFMRRAPRENAKGRASRFSPRARRWWPAPTCSSRSPPRVLGCLSYQWQFNGANIAGASNTNLTLTNVQPTNAGSYTVVVTNSLASVTSAVAVLTVLVPPSVTSPPASRTNECTSTATFTVAASWHGAAELPVVFQRQRDRNATSTSLAMTNVHAAQQGNYTVVVTNSAGQRHQHAGSSDRSGHHAAGDHA